MRSTKERRKILELYNNGLNNSEISRKTNISRTTIRDIIKKYSGEIENLEKEIRERTSIEVFELKPQDDVAKDYSYILGVYLGDGYIDKMPRTERFRIFQDNKYQNIIKYESNALQRLFPKNKLNLIKHSQGCTAIVIYNQHLSKLFPQHGVGVKHKRLIALKEWQRKIVVKYPEQFLKGLIETDGCRYLQDNKYLIYEFTNMSKDIIDLCCFTCDCLDIRYTTSKRKTGKMSVYIRDTKHTQFLDTFIGPKS